MELLNNDHSTGKRKSRNRVTPSVEEYKLKTASDDIVEPGPGHSETHSSSPIQPQEADEHTIEEFLSDIDCTPRPDSPIEPPSHNQEEKKVTPTPLAVRTPSPTDTRQDTIEESTPTVSRTQREMERRIDSFPADLTEARSKPDQETTRTSSTSTTINPTVSENDYDDIPALTLPVPVPLVWKTPTTGAVRMKKRKKIIAPSPVSTQHWKGVIDFQSQQVTERQMVLGRDKSERGRSEEAHDSDYPVLIPSPPPPPSPHAKSVSGQTSSSKAESAPGPTSHSLTGARRTKSIPLPQAGTIPGPSALSPIIIPTTSADGDGHRSPVLSPHAKKRLERFDRDVKRIELREKEQRSEDRVMLTKKSEKVKEGKYGERGVAGGSGRQEVVKTFEEKRWKGKEKEQEQGSIFTPKPPKEKKREPLFLDDYDSEDQPKHGRDKSKSKSKSKSVSKETAQPLPNPSDSDTRSLVQPKKKKSKSKEEYQQRLSAHQTSDSEVQFTVKSDTAAVGSGSGLKLKMKDALRHKPASKPKSKWEKDTEEEPKDKEDNTSSTRTANTKLTGNNTSKSVSKPQSKVDTNTAAAAPKPPLSSTSNNANARPSVKPPRSTSFVDDIIPETEESSQSQEKVQAGLQSSLHRPVPPPLASARPLSKSKPLSRTSSAVEALASSMDMDVDVGNHVEDLEDGVVEEKIFDKKVSENGAVTTATKPFGPIPRLSPSAFTPHLPSSSLPESTIESIEGDDDDASKRATAQNEDDSIEQFESPVKSGGERRVGILDVGSREKQRTKAKDRDKQRAWDSDLNRRGLELAEAARKREKERLRAEEEEANSSNLVSTSTLGAKNVHAKTDRLPVMQEKGKVDVSLESVPPNVSLPPGSTAVQQMEDTPIDLDGGIQTAGPTSSSSVTAPASTSAIVGVEGSQSVEVELRVESHVEDTDMVEERPFGPVDLRQEEEESSQDIMMELHTHQQQQQQEGFKVVRNKDLAIVGIKDDAKPVIQINSQPINETMLDEGACHKHDVDGIPSVFLSFFVSYLSFFCLKKLCF